MRNLKLKLCEINICATSPLPKGQVFLTYYCWEGIRRIEKPITLLKSVPQALHTDILLSSI